MKKILLGMFTVGYASGAFGGGLVILENSINSSSYVSIGGPYNGHNAAAGGTYQVALLWFNGTSFQQIGAVYQTSTAQGDGPGYFNGETVTVPTYASTGTFIVEGWTGNYANYAAAQASGTSITGQTASFTSAEGSTGVPPNPPVPLTLTHPGPGNWDGNLILSIPEPSTIALGGLGAVAFWLFRRRKTGA